MYIYIYIYPTIPLQLLLDIFDWIHQTYHLHFLLLRNLIPYIYTLYHTIPLDLMIYFCEVDGWLGICAFLCGMASLLWYLGRIFKGIQGVPGEFSKDFLREDWGTLGITIRILGNHQPPLGESPATLSE